MRWERMENNNYLSAKRYADLTMELLEKHQIPPSPINYSVFFLYTNGSNPLLNQQINLQLKQNNWRLLKRLHLGFRLKAERQKHNTYAQLIDFYDVNYS